MKKLGFLCLALCLALSSLGVVYAAWSKTLQVGGTVNTGTFVAGLTSPSATSSPSDSAGTCSITTSDSKSFTVAISNGFPGFTGTVTYSISDTGTIPAMLSDVRLTRADGTVIDSWNGNATSFSLVGGTFDDVTVSNSLSPATGIGDGLASSIAGTLTVTIPAGLTGDSGALSGSFKIEVITQQNPV